MFLFCFFVFLFIIDRNSSEPDSQSLEPHEYPQDSAMEFLPREEFDALQRNQFTVLSFASSVISTISPILLDHLNRDFPWTTPTDNRKISIPLVAAAFVNQCLLLLDMAVNLIGHIKLKEKYIFSFYSLCHISIII